MKKNKKTNGTAVKFKLVLPGAQEVFLAGTFNDWRTKAFRMIAEGNGKWVKALALPPGRYEYLFVADGVWVDDPSATERTPNSHGSLNSVVTVPAARAEA